MKATPTRKAQCIVQASTLKGGAKRSTCTSIYIDYSVVLCSVSEVAESGCCFRHEEAGSGTPFDSPLCHRHYQYLDLVS